MILIFEVILASIAALLSMLSFRTLKAIKHLGVGKSFWIPVFVSSILFLFGSILTAFYEVGFSFVAQTVELSHISRILALAILVCGIYSYSRRVKASLKEEFTIPQRLAIERLKLEFRDEDSSDTLTPIQEKREESGGFQKSLKRETAHECKHQLGYLRTLPKNASIPDECLSCNRIIECKHSLTSTLKSSPRQA